MGFFPSQGPVVFAHIYGTSLLLLARKCLAAHDKLINVRVHVAVFGRCRTNDD